MTVPARTRFRRPRGPVGGLPLAGTAGQATIETVALVPVILVLGLGMLQLLALGYSSVLAGNAAEAGALALAAGSDARAGVKQALPGWSTARTRVTVTGGRVEVRLRPPSPLRALAERLEVTAAASVEAP
jgi:Flp pilus assembly protein TadG